jgi:hypothetical protein
MGPNRGEHLRLVLFLAGLTLALPALGGLLPFPLSANQRGTVTCLEQPDVAYDVYLPANYSTNGPPLPIFYTMSSGGGGMVTTFQTALSQLNIIGVGLIGSRNGVAAGVFEREAFAVVRDLRRRVLFDPTAQMSGGISGGGTAAFNFARMHGQHISGVLEMAGSLGVQYGSAYPSTVRLQTNLFIAWTIGDQDPQHNYFPYDSPFLTNSCSDFAQLWTFAGGHVAPPTSMQVDCLNWLLNSRVLPGANDQSDSSVRAANWRSRVAAGELEPVLRECVNVLMTQPRSWDALQAQLVLDDYAADYSTFRSLNIDGIAQGDYAQDMFFYSAQGAAYAGDMSSYHSAMRGLTGVTDSSGDLAQGIHDLLVKFSYPNPILQPFPGPTQGAITLSVSKDTPGLTYVLQSRTNLSNDAWVSRSDPATETNTLWSSAISNSNPAGTEFFRLETLITYRTNQIPTLSNQPVDRTEYERTTTRFSITAIGNGPFGYQWRKNGTDLTDGGNVSGATTKTLTLANLSQADAAEYDVIVIGYNNATSSPPANLTVIPFDSTQVPTITAQPQNRTNYEGTTATFAVGVSGTGPFGYQWRKNGLNLNDGANVAGSITPTLTLSSLSQLDAGNYDVVVIGYHNATSSPPAILTVLAYSGTLILYEPFDYSAGGTVSTNNSSNWATGGTGGNDTRIAPGSLNYSGLTPSIGNSLTNGAAGLGLRRVFTPGINTGVVYFSALFNLASFGSWNGSATQVGALTASDNLSFRLQVLAKTTSASTYLLGVQKGGSGATTTFDTADRQIGATLLLVGKYDFTVTPNVATLWINPDPSTFGAVSEPGTGSISATTGPDNIVIDRFNMRQNTVTTVPGVMQWDELRIGLSWADVTPTF